MQRLEVGIRAVVDPVVERGQPNFLREADLCTPGWPVAPWSASWHDVTMDATIVLGRQGRLVIPAEIRAALGLSSGDRLHVHFDGDRLVLQRPEDALAELRRLGMPVPRARSLVEELLAERQAAAADE